MLLNIHVLRLDTILNRVAGNAGSIASMIIDNGTTIYIAYITFNVNNKIIIIEILKTNTSTIAKPQTLPQYILLHIK